MSAVTWNGSREVTLLSADIMDSEPGHSLIIWTARLSVALYVTAVWLLRTRSQSPSGRFAVLWVSAWAVCVVHVIFAFHFQHHWNHSAALQHTADMTERVTGLHWAGGLYINYVFLVWWGYDAIQRLRGVALRSSIIFQAVAAFMMFNATVVFGPRIWIAVALLLCVAVVWRWVRDRQRT
jgi:hypothetical protein